MVYTERIHLSTKGNSDIIDITPETGRLLKTSGLKDGIACLCVVGSTGAITTCEYEPGLERDLKEFFRKIIPPGKYHHDQTWNDGNGHSHLSASLVGPSIAVPFVKGKLTLGTWQQVIFIDFDTRPRDREITVQFVGE